MKRAICILFILLSFDKAYAGDTLRITLEEAVLLAQKQSPQAIAARHQYRAAYWAWRSHKADYLPGISFSSNTTLNRSISSITFSDGKDGFVHRNQLLNDGAVTISQNLSFLGGNVYFQTGLQRLDIFSDKQVSYRSTPLVIGYSQNLFGYNHLKWNRKIEPVRYQQAKKMYIETLELVAATAVGKFFQLATAQSNWRSASYNYAAADTLFQYARGRYKIGTITENEMLQLEINFLSEQTSKLNAAIEVSDNVQDLRSFLGINNTVEIETIVSDSVPVFIVPEKDALKYAHRNSPDLESFALQELEAESMVANTKAANRLKADLYVEFGLTQTDQTLRSAYRSPLDQQLVSLGIRIPILDWGVGRGRVEVAKSNLSKIKTNLAQARTDFDANVFKIVKQFNLQSDKIRIARMTADRAVRRNEVAYRLYLLGKSTVLDLNASISEKDSSQRTYINELKIYWSLYYGLRSITGYDFASNGPIYLPEVQFNN